MGRISTGDYNFYKERILYITSKGSKEQLVALYQEIIDKYGRCDDLKMLDDFYNKKWRIF